MKLSTKILLFITATVLFTGCVKDDDPTADQRDNFVGSWICQESSQIFGNATYTINISKSASDNENVKMTNFYQLGSGTFTFATVSSGGTSANIYQQVVSGNTIKGSGTYSNNKITFTFTANDGQATDNVTVNATRN